MVQAASQLLFYTELTCPLLTYYVAVWFIPHVGIHFMQEVRAFSSVPLVVWCKFVCDCRSYPLTPLWLTPVWMSPMYSLNKKDLVCYSLLDQENVRHCTSRCPWLWDERLSCSYEHHTPPLQTYKQKMICSVMVSSFCIFFPIFVIHLQLTAPFQRARTDVSHTHIFRRQCFKSHVSSRSVSETSVWL